MMLARAKQHPALVAVALLLLLLAGSAVGAWSSTPTSPHAQTVLAFTHVTVVDPTGQPAKTDMTVVIAGDRIAAVGKSRKVKVPAGAQVVDATGKFLIPGLWDMHVHSGSYEEASKAFAQVVASGITGVRDMGAPLEDVLRLRAETAEGKLLGPRLVVSGPMLQGPLPPHLARLPLLRSVGNEQEARQAVVSLKQAGVDFIKVQDSLPRELYFAVASEAAQQRLPFVGHIPPAISAQEASDAGQGSVEHLGGTHYGVLIACSENESELHKEILSIMKGEIASAFQGRDPDNSKLFRADLTTRLLERYSQQKAAALFRRFAKNNTWQVPTLVSLRALWDRKDLREEDARLGEKVLAKEYEVVNSMRKAGVRIMAGTDGPLAQAARSLHEELLLLVQAGFTPMEALQSATSNPAEFLGLAHSLGTIQKGKSADMVLLDANPLEDIRITQRVSGVVLRGRYLPRSELDQLLANAEAELSK